MPGGARPQEGTLVSGNSKRCTFHELARQSVALLASRRSCKRGCTLEAHLQKVTLVSRLGEADY